MWYRKNNDLLRNLKTQYKPKPPKTYVENKFYINVQMSDTKIIINIIEYDFKTMSFIHHNTEVNMDTKNCVEEENQEIVNDILLYATSICEGLKITRKQDYK